MPRLSTLRFHDACDSLPLFDKPRKGVSVGRIERDQVRMHVSIDWHVADCGVGDCFGTTLTIDLIVSPGEGGCWLDRASVESRPFDDCEPPLEETHTSHERTDFAVSPLRPNLCSRALNQIVLTSSDLHEAVAIREDNVYLFEPWEISGMLRFDLPGDSEDETACCWPAIHAQ